MIDSPRPGTAPGTTPAPPEQTEAELAQLRREAALRPPQARSFWALGMALHARGENEEALDYFRRALAIEPWHPQQQRWLGDFLASLKRWDEAEQCYRRALAVNPGMAGAHQGLGGVHLANNRYQQAVASYRAVVRLTPDAPEAYCNLGIALGGMNLLDGVTWCYDHALQLRPGFRVALLNRALLRLTQGDYRRGWQDYEARWNDENSQRNFTEPLWLGESDLKGRSLLLYAEQGYGDTLQCVRYVPLLAARGAQVVLEVPEALLTLLTDLPGAARVCVQGEAPRCDFRCPLMSLPLAFGTELHTIPAPPAYLDAKADRRAAWAAHLPPPVAPRVGLVWSGQPLHGNDHNRSLPLALLQPLLAQEGSRDPVIFVSLQKKVRPGDMGLFKSLPGILNLGPHLHDFAETAAAIANLDLVIAVDTAVAHLAGALGKPVWILLPAIGDFRWLQEREDSPWYPSARLFRQRQPGCWKQPLAELRAALDGLRCGWRLAAAPAEPSSAMPAVGSMAFRRHWERSLQSPDLRRHGEFGLRWTPDSQLLYTGSRQHRRDGAPLRPATFGLAQLLLGAASELPWLPSGDADGDRQALQYGQFMHALLDQAFQTVQDGSTAAAAVAAWRTGITAGADPDRDRDACARFCEGLDHDALIRLSPYYFALRRMALGRPDHLTRKWQVRFDVAEAPPVSEPDAPCRAMLAGMLPLLAHGG